MPLSRFVARGAFLFPTINIALIFAGWLLPAQPARADAWALLIGIDRYEDSDGIASLGGADNDAIAMAKALTESGGFPAAHVHVLTSSGVNKPRRNTILAELEALRQHVRPGDTVFVSFSGHGVESGGVPYLLPYDAYITTPSLVTNTSIREEAIREHLKDLPAKALILVFDMCRVNADRSGSAGTAAEDAHLSAAQVRALDFSAIVKSGGPGSSASSHPQIVAEFFACSPDSRSYEWRAKERGYFSYFLEQGLRGQAAAPGGGGGVSLDALKRYLTTAVPAAVRENELGKDQTPTADIVGPLDAGGFVLAGGSGGVAAPPAPVVTDVDTSAHLTITVNAADATAFLDGQPFTPGREMSLDLGLDKTKTFELGVKAIGYRSRVQTITVSRGANRPVNVVLEKAETASKSVVPSLPPPSAPLSSPAEPAAAPPATPASATTPAAPGAAAPAVVVPAAAAPAVVTGGSAADAEQYFNLGIAAIGSREYAKAIDAFTKAIALRRDDTTLYNRALACYDLGESDPSAYAKSSADAEAALAIRPDYAEARLLKADAEFGDKKYSLAAADYSLYLAFHDIPAANKAYASGRVLLSYIDAKDYAGVVRATDVKIQSGTAEPQDYLVRGTAYLAQRDYTAAIPALIKYVDSKPDDATGFFNLGIAYAGKQDNSDAAASYEKAATLKVDYFDAANQAATVYKALADADQGNVSKCQAEYDKSIAFYEKAAAMPSATAKQQSDADFNEGVALESKAKALDSLEPLKAAVIVWGKWLSLAPDDPDVPKIKQHISDLQAKIAKE